MDVKILQSKTISAEEKQKQKTQMILLSILLAVFVVMLISSLVKAQKKASARKPPPPVAADFSNPTGTQDTEQTTAPDLSKAPDLIAPNGDVNNVTWGSSPFSMRGQGQGETPKAGPLQLAGIIYDPNGNSYAMFGEKIVKKGDRIADNTVKDIKRNQVILETGDGKELVLQN